MRTLFADLRYAFRVMSRTPSFAVAVVSVLALGIGASTTIFSIVNAVLLRPLPFEEPERLVRIFTRTPGGRLFELSPGKFYDWQRDARSFEGMAMYQCCGAHRRAARRPWESQSGRRRASEQRRRPNAGASRDGHDSARLAREFPKSDDRWGAVVVPMQEEIVGNSRTMLLILLGAVGLVLLIACANVGNLLFTRALSRRKEIAIRSALGGGRVRLCQQLLTEALLLAGAGGALGLLLAYGTLTSASTLLAGQVPRAEEISIDGRVLLFAVGVSMLTGLFAGTLPAVRVSRSALSGALKDGGRSDGAIGLGTRRALIVCEVALSLVLLMGAGVMMQSLLALR
jgi:hypothetical protein